MREPWSTFRPLLRHNKEGSLCCSPRHMSSSPPETQTTGDEKSIVPSGVCNNFNSVKKKKIVILIIIQYTFRKPLIYICYPSFSRSMHEVIIVIYTLLTVATSAWAVELNKKENFPSDDKCGVTSNTNIYLG